jgi:uncharacterized protein YeaO (DUF488 family)
MTKFVVKRVYEPAHKDDGYRVLVDRVWPRGVSKEAVHLDEWCKDVAPSNELRQWFKHDPEKYSEFKKRYEHELKANPAVEDIVREWKKHNRVTLLYGAYDTDHNQAVVLKGYIRPSRRPSFTK